MLLINMHITHSHAQNGCTCLHLAAESGRLEVVQYLVETGGQELLLCKRQLLYSAIWSVCALELYLWSRNVSSEYVCLRIVSLQLHKH